MKTCPKCERNLSLNEFYVRNRGKSKEPASWCKKCLNANSAERSRKLKRKAIEYKGGKCQHCGYDRYDGALQFHHNDPAEKDLRISSSRRTFDKIKKELDKCTLLCSNCHSEEHGRINGVFSSPTRNRTSN